MRFLVAISGFVAAFVFVLALAFTPAQAMEKDLAWQSVITNQIEAFRRGDGAGALGYAGAAFKAQYDDPDAFYADIARMGYGPILDSLSHSFGAFEQDADATNVVQVVNILGPKQGLYEAVYQLRAEPDGWRVQGVFMRKQEGVGV